MAVLFVLSVLAVGAPFSGASSHSVSIDDAQGDVSVCAAGQASACSAPPSPDVTRFLDLTKVTFGKETGNNFTIEFTVAGMQTDPPSATSFFQTAFYLACFSYAGVQYGVTSMVAHQGPAEANKRVIPGQLFVPAQSCSWAGAADRVAEVGLNYPEDAGIDFAKGMLWLRVQRKDLADLHGLAGQDARSPAPGDSLEGLSAEMRGTYALVNNKLMEGTDSAGPGGPFPFTLATANELLEIRVKTNTVDRGLRVPEYSVDAGGFQAIPVEVVNRANEQKSVNLTVELKDGDASKWSFSLVPVVKVPGLSDSGDEGLRVVTLVVEPQEGVAHLEQAKVSLTASFVDQPDTRGSIDVDVRAIFPPNATNPKMWLHYGNDANGNAKMWMNTLKDDPRELKGEAGKYTPNPEGGRFTTFADPDVQPSKDLIFDAQKDVVLNLNVTSTAEANVDYVIYLANGERTVAETTGRARVPSGPSQMTIAIPVRPLTRDDKELRVESGVGKGIRLWIQMNPSSGPSDLPVSSPPPTLELVVPGSSLGLPILRSEAAGLTNISAKGARISLNQVAEKDLHVNPGRTRAINFTVLNEGVKKDTIDVQVAFNLSAGWRVAVLPAHVFTLEPGNGADFALFVTPPMSAAEEETLALQISASSKVDPTVVSALRYEFIVTKGVQLDDDGGLADGLKSVGKKKKSPGLDVLAALAAVGAALVLLRRRKA